jgi:hypothetical protein
MWMSVYETLICNSRGRGEGGDFLKSWHKNNSLNKLVHTHSPFSFTLKLGKNMMSNEETEKRKQRGDYGCSVGPTFSCTTPALPCVRLPRTQTLTQFF